MIKKLVAASSAAALALTFQVGAAFADDGAKRGGTLIWAVQNTPRHLNPAVQSGIATGEPGNQLFAAPLRYDEDWTPQPY
ncbi:MAG: peptide ABC transporter substrate-binding protein, partial [SAR116 cluster bacterium]|nr:peptide ABC transporter substrate-binding protein [SAR116 cluster bacterium]